MKRALLLPLCVALGTGCLPDDTRDEPAQVLVNLRSGDATLDGVTTTDGWRVGFARVVVTVGNLGLDGDGCSQYAGASYLRILDGRIRAPQKVGLMFGIGDCTLELRARNPEFDTLLGEGISENDKTLMRDGVSDPRETQPAGITFIVIGTAVKDTRHITFSWLYRRRRLAYDDCDVGGTTILPLTSGATRTIELRVRAETLFQDQPDPMLAKLRFDPIASADTNGDGIVTFAELDAKPLAEAGLAFDAMKVPESTKWKFVGDYVHEALFPHILRVGEDGRCKVRNQTMGQPR